MWRECSCTTCELPSDVVIPTTTDVRFVAALKSISVRSSDIRGIDAIEPMAVNHVVPVMAKTAQWLP